MGRVRVRVRVILDCDFAFICVQSYGGGKRGCQIYTAWIGFPIFCLEERKKESWKNECLRTEAFKCSELKKKLFKDWDLIRARSSPCSLFIFTVALYT